MDKLRELFLHNMGLKSLALLFSFLIWLQVANQRTVQRTVTLPVELVNIPIQLEISDDYQNTVEVVIRSDRGTVALEAQNMSVLVDLQGATAGTKLIRLSEGNIRNRPSGLNILSMTPRRVTMRLENTLEKVIEVTPELIGKAAKNFEVTSVEVIPREVVVSGPESRIQRLLTAKTEPIRIGGLSSGLELTAYVDLEDPRLRIEGPVSVKVAVAIEPKRRKIRVRGVQVKVLPENSKVSLITRRVSVIGSVSVFFKGKISSKDLLARVNITGQESSSIPYEVVPEIEVAQEHEEIFRLQSVVPEFVKVKIK